MKLKYNVLIHIQIYNIFIVYPLRIVLLVLLMFPFVLIGGPNAIMCPNIDYYKLLHYNLLYQHHEDVIYSIS